MPEDNTLPDTLPKHRNQHSPVITKAKQTAYLKALAEIGVHSKACQLADCHHSMPMHWASKSTAFAKAMETAKALGEKVLLARYESDMDTVLLPETPLDIDSFAKLQNSRFFRMKKLDPSYRDNAQVNVNAIGPVAIQFNIASPAPTDSESEKQ